MQFFLKRLTYLKNIDAEDGIPHNANLYTTKAETDNFFSPGPVPGPQEKKNQGSALLRLCRRKECLSGRHF